MLRYGRWRTLVGVVGALALVVTAVWAQTAAPPKAKPRPLPQGPRMSVPKGRVR